MGFKNLEEIVIKRKKIFNGQILKLRIDTVELPDGRQAKREVVEHSETSAILALTEKNEVVLVKQFRLPVNKVLFEIPAGLVKKGENPDETAKRELLEETGYVAGSLKKIFSYYSSPGFTDELMHFYFAKNLKKLKHKRDFDEFLEIRKIPIKKCFEMLKKNEFKDSKTIVALLFLKNYEKLS